MPVAPGGQEAQSVDSLRIIMERLSLIGRASWATHTFPRLRYRPTGPVRASRPPHIVCGPRGGGFKTASRRVWRVDPRLSPVGYGRALRGDDVSSIVSQARPGEFYIRSLFSASEGGHSSVA